MIMIMLTFNYQVRINNEKAKRAYLSDKVNYNESAWKHAKSEEERKCLSQKCILELLAAVETWSQNLEDGAFKNHGQSLTNQNHCCYSVVTFFL